MSNVITYKKVTDVLADIASRHYLINTFFVGEIDDLNAEDLIFPVFQMYPTNATFPQTNGEYKTIDMTLKCRVLDKQTQNGNNEIEVHNDTFATAQDIINEINQHPFYSRSNVTLAGDISLNPLSEYTDDYAAGWEFDINLQLINNNSFCGLPMADITGYSASGPVSTGYSISFQYLQCDGNLSACTYLSAFIDTKISVLTGVTSQNYYTTGATLVGTNLIFNRNDMLSAYTVDLSSLSVGGNFLALSGGTVTGNTLFTQNLSASTYYSGSTSLSNVINNMITGTTSGLTGSINVNGLNTYTGGTIANQTINISGLTIDNITVSGNSSFQTILSGGTNLFNIINNTVTGATSGITYTKVQPGLNTYTGGTSSLPTINVSALTINTLTASGTSNFTGVLQSGGTDLSLLFLSVNDGNDITRVQPGYNTYTGGTGNNPTVNISAATLSYLSATTISGGTLYSGSTNLSNIINNMITGTTSGITGGGGSSNINGLNTYTGGTQSAQSINISGGTFDNITITGNTVFSGASASTIIILNSGTTNVSLNDWSQNIIRTGVTRSNIIGGSGNTVDYNLRNVQIIGGLNIAGKTSDTVFVNNLTGNSIYASTYYSGSTELSSLFAISSSVSAQLATKANLSGATFTNTVNAPALSATTLSGETIYSGSTPLSSIFLSTGATTTASSVGLGNSIFKQKTGVNLEFRSLSAGTNITITTGDTITINSTATSGSGGTSNSSLPFNLGVSASDEITALTSGDAKITFLTPRSGTLSKVVAGLTTSGSTTTTVRIKKNGTVVSNNNIDLISGVFSSSISSPTLTATTMTEWDTYSVDIVTAGTGAKGLKVYFEGSYYNPFSATTSTIPWELGLAMSDEITNIGVGTSKVTMLTPFSGTVTGVTISLSTSGSTTTTVDINKNGTTIFSTRPTIDANEFSSQTAATPPVITGSTWSVYDTLTFDIDTAGTSAKGLKVWLTGYKNI